MASDWLNSSTTSRRVRQLLYPGALVPPSAPALQTPFQDLYEKNALEKEHSKTTDSTRNSDNTPNPPGEGTENKPYHEKNAVRGVCTWALLFLPPRCVGFFVLELCLRVAFVILTNLFDLSS